MFVQRVGELCRKQGLSYSKFARASGIGFRTAKELYEDPSYQMNTITLYKCCKFFNLPLTELLVESDKSIDSNIATSDTSIRINKSAPCKRSQATFVC